jgi:hypothetical protein
MAKRARGSSTRPGQRARTQRPGPRPSPIAPAPTPRPATLTPQEEARAAELEAEIVAEERAAEASLRRTRDRSRRETVPAAPTRPGSLAVRASEEYDYVVRDVRRIALIGGSLVIILIALWAVMHLTGATAL